MKIIKSIFLLLFVFQTSFGQKKKYISENYTKIEALEYAGSITFYLEEKNNTILAYQNGNVKWESNVMKVCGKPTVGKPWIREISIVENCLKIVYGKHSFAKIEIETGKVICEGQD